MPRSVGLVGLLVVLLAWAVGGCQVRETVVPVCLDGTDVRPGGCEPRHDCFAPHDQQPGCECGRADVCLPDEVAADFCAAWDVDLDETNLASLRRFALSQALAVVTGSFGEPRVLQGDSYVPLSVEEVHYGWSFLVGLEVMVRVHPELIDGLQESPRWVVGLTQSHPSDWEQDQRPVWGNVLTLLPQADAGPFADVIGYRTEPAPMVAVVRIVAQDEYRTTFEVVDALAGTFPPTFQDNWYASWDLPYPGFQEEDETWIVSVLGLTEYPDDVIVGSVYDIRLATPEHLSVVNAALTASSPLVEREHLLAVREEIHTGIRFHHAPWVVSSVVSGLAMECCTGAGGTFVQHEISETLLGSDTPPRFVTGGHGYYGDEDCGDAFLQGLETMVDPSEHMETPFDCLEYPAGDSWDANAPNISSGVSVRLPATAADRPKVEAWLAASAPLYQLYPPQAEVPEQALEQDPANAPWSLPMDAVEAFVTATHIALLEIEEVTYDEALDVYEVVFSTTFSIHEYDHLERHSIKLAFRCGDPRLLEVGSRWIGGLVLVDPWYFGAEEGPALERSFLIPGALVPEAEMNSQLESILAYYLN